MPYREGEDQLDALSLGLSRLPTYRAVVTKLLFPVFGRANAKRDQGVARIALCRVVLALKAYNYEHGAYPETLYELQETLDWKLPEDPFSGADFVYQRQGEGFKLYSIGQDLKDSGGQPRGPIGYGYKPQLDFDIVWECSS